MAAVTRQAEERSQARTTSSSHRSIYQRTGKRVFDVAASGAGLAALWPLLALCALLVRLSSRGPIFYRQLRVGRGGVPFCMLKFRSMRTTAEPGRQITISGDTRVTTAGRFLRASKLDELPQLWNVFTGDMSLVGPRPEVPSYVASYTAEQRRVLEVRPGITDPASIAYRHEESVLATSNDPECFYREVVMPDKLLLNLKYLQAISFRNDLQLLLGTFLAIFRA
jgi:lipopolysaccharide/colanic/teichoic acid biosynthesis glycosyltransferase